MSTVTINNKNVQEYINKQLIDPYSVKIDLNTTKTASDNVHRWITLADAVKGGYKFNFDYDINDKPTEAPTLPEVVVTPLPRMYSVGAGESAKIKYGTTMDLNTGGEANHTYGGDLFVKSPMIHLNQI